MRLSCEGKNLNQVDLVEMYNEIILRHGRPTLSLWRGGGYYIDLAMYPTLPMIRIR